MFYVFESKDTIIVGEMILDCKYIFREARISQRLKRLNEYRVIDFVNYFADMVSDYDETDSRKGCKDELSRIKRFVKNMKYSTKVDKNSRTLEKIVIPSGRTHLELDTDIWCTKQEFLDKLSSSIDEYTDNVNSDNGFISTVESFIKEIVTDCFLDDGYLNSAMDSLKNYKSVQY